MWKYVLRNFLRNKRRSALTVLSIAVSIFLLVTMATVLAMLDLAANMNDEHMRLVVRHKVSLMMDTPRSYRERIRSVPGVEQLTILNWFGGVYIERKNFFAQFGIEADTFPEVFPEYKISPEQWQSFMESRTGAIAGKKLAQRFGWKTGDAIYLKGDIYPVDLDLRLSGTYEAPDEGSVFFHQKYLDELMHPNETGVGTWWLRVASQEDLARITSAVDAMFANSPAPVKTETEKAFQMEFISMMGNVQALFRNTGVAVTFAILMVTANTMAMSFRERTSEIAVLKTLGFGKGRILGAVLSESLLVALAGGAIGTGGAWALYKFANPTAGFFPIFFVTPSVAALGLGVALLVGVLGGGVPALQAARLGIVEGLRKVA